MTRRDDDLQRELRQHLELEAADRQADGLEPAAARREALRALGGVVRIREDARAVWRAAWIEHVVQDLRYAGRLCRRHPGFTLGAVLILAIGISAASTIVGAIDAVVLRPLPFDRPAQIVHLTQTNPSRGIDAFTVSLPLYRDWRRLNTSFAGMAARRDGTAALEGLGDPLQVPVQFVSHDLPALLGLRPVAGRDFQDEDDRPGAAPVVMLTASFWRSAFGSDPSAVGRTVMIDRQPHRIIGVVADAVAIVGAADVLLPIVPHTEDRRNFSDLEVYARLKPGVSRSRAADEMAVLAQRIAREYPDGTTGWSVRVEPLAEAVVGPTTPRVLYLLLAAVGALLLVACTNLSGLLLVRAHARTREIAIRTAIGGGRGRIVRQLLTESLLLAAMGGAVGIALSYGGVAALRAFAMASVPRAEHIRVDGWVLLATVAVSLAAGILAGLAPARQAARVDVQRGIKEGAPAVMRGGSAARHALVVAQLAVSIALLASAGLALRALARLSTVDLGFAPTQIVTAQVAPRSNPEAFVASLLDRLRARPDVTAVAATSAAPMSAGNTSLHVYPVGSAAILPTASIQADWRVVSDGYFHAMQTTILSGRDFTPHDDARAPKVIVVNETLARRVWGDASPIGRQLDLGGGGGEPATVVGLVRDVRGHTPSQPAAPTYYMSAYRGIYGPMTVVVRTSSRVETVVPAIRAEVRALDPALPVFMARTMDDLLQAQLAPQRLMATLLGGFALMALLLAAIGIYAAMAHATGQRRREFALRLALGATRADVIRPLLRDSAALVASGVVIGTLLAVPLARLMRALIADVSPTDPLAFGGAVLVLGSAAMLACYLPARRAARVSAAEVLRST